MRTSWVDVGALGFNPGIASIDGRRKSTLGNGFSAPWRVNRRCEWYVAWQEEKECVCSTLIYPNLEPSGDKSRATNWVDTSIRLTGGLGLFVVAPYHIYVRIPVRGLGA